MKTVINENYIICNFGKTLAEIRGLNSNNKNKNLIQNFKNGDIIACYAGFPHKELCIVELITDKLDINNVIDGISGKSIIPDTSHVISGNWFKIN